MSEAQNWRIITGQEARLIKSELFHLEREQRLRSETYWQMAVVDVGEHPVERPKKATRLRLGQKKRQTLKSQVLTQAGSGCIRRCSSPVTRATRGSKSYTPTASSR